MVEVKAKDRMRNVLGFIPNLVRLLGRLITDKRVPKIEKALLGGAILYAIMPLDFIPDVIPFVGQVDDAYLIALTLLRLIQRTDESIVREHWDGGGDIIKLTDTITAFAPRFLPKRVTRVLTSKVETTEKTDEIVNAVNRKGGWLVETPQSEMQLPPAKTALK